MGCAMKANLLAAWRKHFVLEDHMLEVSIRVLLLLELASTGYYKALDKKTKKVIFRIFNALQNGPFKN